MLLFKPLKELRAKRKGTHLVGLHACAVFSNFLFISGFYENKSHWKRWKAETIHLCLAVQCVCFAVFFVLVCFLSFCFTERVRWNRWPSVELSFCIDSDKPSLVSRIRFSLTVSIHSYNAGHHCVSKKFRKILLALSVSEIDVILRVLIITSWGLNIGLQLSEFNWTVVPVTTHHPVHRHKFGLLY